MKSKFATSLLLLLKITLVLMVALAMRTNSAPGGEDEEEDEVHELMEKVHEGKKSPWKKAQRAAKEEPVDWDALNAALTRLDAMSKALTKAKNKEVREASDGYVDAVKQLGEQLKKRDTMGARKAIMLLGESCSDCHYKGGPGGRLED